LGKLVLKLSSSIQIFASFKGQISLGQPKSFNRDRKIKLLKVEPRWWDRFNGGPCEKRFTSFDLK
jgi:hypothetical protein